jgi:[ribosomal protein S5]-alanine N-acetyltransferase
MFSFDPFPTLETPRFVLRRIDVGDTEAMFRNHSNPEVVRYFGRPPDTEIKQTEQRLELIEDGIRNGTAIRWAITRKEDGALLGSTGFWKWNQPHLWAEIGYELDPAAWGSGVMTEALRVMLRYGYDTMGLHRAEANIAPENTGSRRVLEKLGFSREAILRENWFFDGRFGDTHTYGLLVQEFDRSRVEG